MKLKVLVVALLMVLALSVISDAQQSTTAISSGPFTSSQVIAGRPARLVDVGVQTDGTAAVTVLIYDNATTASGRVIAFAYAPSGTKVAGWNCPIPSMATNGLYAAVSGTGVTRVLVSFDPQ